MSSPQTVAPIRPTFPPNREIREGDRKPRKPRQKKPTLKERAAPLLVNAYFWYVLLAVSGALMVGVGLGLRYGAGAGIAAMGGLSIAGSEIVRRGMMRV